MIAFQSLAAIILVAGGIGVWQIIQLNGAARIVADIHTPHLYQIQRAQNAVIHANLTLTAIGGGFLDKTAIVRVQEYLEDGNEAVNAILEGGTQVLGRTVPATEQDNVFISLREMRNYLIRMGSLAEEQMDAMERFGEFSRTLEGSFRNARLGYINEASRAEEIIVTELTEQRLRMQQTARVGIFTLAVATAMSLLAAVIFALLFARSIVRRVHNVMEVSAALAQGDLTASSTTRGTDEIAELTGNINVAINELGRIINTVVGRVDVLGNTGEQLTDSTTRTVETVQEINHIVQTGRDQNDDLVANTTETSAIIEEMARNIESLDESVQQQASMIEQSSTAIEEMIASVENITQVSTHARDRLGTLTEATQSGQSSIGRQEELIAEMSSAGRSLQEANQLIAGVAGQTNLLAMNAAIEAAHAGSAGRGFAVVAEEIRKLAETTSRQSDRVKKDINSMQTLITRLVDGSTVSTRSFVEVQAALEEVRSVFSEIFSAMEQQRTGGAEILQALSQMREMAGSVSGGSAEMKSGNQQMLEAMRNVGEISRRSRDVMERIGDGMTTISNAMADISMVSDRNRTQIVDIINATNTLILPSGDSASQEDPDQRPNADAHSLSEEISDQLPVE